MRELEVTEDPPQKNMAIMGMPMATMPPVPVPKRAYMAKAILMVLQKEACKSWR